MPRRKSSVEETPTTPQEVMKMINKKFGAGTITTADDESLKITRLPTGVLSVDYLTQGGFPRGRHVELYGSANVGKTALTYYLIGTSQRAGLHCGFLDVEKTYDPIFAKSLGVNVKELAYHKQRYGNQLIDIMEAMLRSGTFDVLVLDSIAALLPKGEMEKSMEAGSYGTEQAKLMSAALRRLTAANKRTVLVYINQTRDNIGSIFAKKQMTSGGRAMAFYAGMRIELVRTENIKRKGIVVDISKGEESQKDVVKGHRVLVRIEKNKMQPTSEPVLTPRGWKQIGQIKLNDYVMGSNGEPIPVVGLYPQKDRRVFKVTFNDNSWTRCGPEHLWQVEHAVSKDKKILTTEQLASDLRSGRTLKWRLPLLSKPVRTKGKLPLDPYLLGAFLGDGNLRKTGIRFTNKDAEIIMEIENRLPLGIALKKEKGDNYSYRITGGNHGGARNPVLSACQQLGLCGTHSHTKFIPNIYLNAPTKDRLELLQGLMDTDGFVGVSPSGNSCTTGIRLTSLRLIKDIVKLVESFGGTATISYGRCWTTKNNEKRQVFTAAINMPAEFPLFKLSYKLEAVVPRSKYLPTRLFKSIERMPDEESICIRVAAKDGLYVTRHYILTHNSGGATPAAQSTFVFDYELGKIDPIEDLLYIGRDTGWIHKKGDYWWLEGREEEKKNGRTRFKKWLEQNNKAQRQLTRWIKEIDWSEE